MSQKSMTTQDIKRGLQNIKKAQLQVLKQLKADSYLQSQQKQKQNKKYSSFRSADNLQNQQQKVNRLQSERSESYSKKNVQKQRLYQINQQQRGMIKNEQSLKSSVNTTASNQNIEKLKKQFSAQREQLNQKFIEITSKLNTLEKQSQQSKNQQKYAQKIIEQFNEKVNTLERQNSRLKSNLLSKDEQIQGSEKVEKKLRSQLQLKTKENTILETQIKSLRGQNVKLSRNVKQLEAQLKEQSVLIKQKKQEKDQLARNDVQSRLNLDLVMREVKTISNNHDFLFNKLKDSAATLQMSWVEKQSQIQTSFSRMLEYFETISSTNEIINNETYDIIGIPSGFNSKNQQSRETIKRQFTGSQSRVQQQEELQYFVREMNKSSNARKQMEDLTLENQSLRKRVRQLTMDLATYESSQPTNPNNRHLTESNRLISMELQEMRQEVMKLKRYKNQMKDDHQEQEKEIVKKKLKVRDLQTRIQIEGRKLVQANNVRFSLQKKCQQQDIEIISLNALIKEFNNKISPSNQSPESASLVQIRQQFTKLLETNSLIQKQNDSLKAINQGLQAQISNLKYEKSQFEANNKQKHEIIDRQIKEKDRLVEELQKKDKKLTDLFNEVQKIKSTFMKNQQQFVKQKQNHENLLEQKSQQILQLRKQIQNLYKQSRDAHQLTFKYQKLQSQFRELSRKSLKMGETLNHLWSIKEAEYYNVHQILGSLRNKQKETNESQQQLSGHF